MTFPVDNLVRAIAPGNASLRATEDGGSGRTLFGHAAVFNRWTKIDSWYEGTFMERNAPGAYKASIAAGGIKIMYAHGRDPSIGEKLLGAPDVMREDKVGLYYESELFDVGYVNDLIPAIRAGQLGASYRFTVDAESIVQPKKATEHNPEMLPERTIEAATVFEVGPCVWGAYPDATSGVRSATDEWIEHLLNDPDVMARFIKRTGPNAASKFLASLPGDSRSKASASTGPGDSGTGQAHVGKSSALLRTLISEAFA